MDEEGFQPSERKLMLHFEPPHDQHDVMGSRFRGWFVAPATTNYRFYLACDDGCDLKLAETPDTVEDPTVLFESITNNGNRRHYYDDAQDQISAWVSLTEGESYFLESMHYAGWGSNYLSLAVEIEQTEMVGHHHAIKEIQKIGVIPKQEFDTIRITVTNLDEGEYVLRFQNFNDPTL